MVPVLRTEEWAYLTINFTCEAQSLVFAKTGSKECQVILFQLLERSEFLYPYSHSIRT
jgi:hypothetical protein